MRAHLRRIYLRARRAVLRRLGRCMLCATRRERHGFCYHCRVGEPAGLCHRCSRALNWTSAYGVKR